MSCKKAIGIAQEIKEMFREKINQSIYITDSEEARKYNFRSSANVLFKGELIPLEIALDKNKMKDFLSPELK